MEKNLYPPQGDILANLRRKLSLVLFLLCLVLMSVVAGSAPDGNEAPDQQTTIKGKVIDSETLTGLPGVNIVVKGTTVGAISDVNGDFTIPITSTDAVLTISFIGYVSQDIPVGNQTVINVSLTTDAVAMEEVVVVGYGTQKKATLTGAVSSIRNEQLVATKNENVVNMLTGKLPGLRVLQKGAAPGAYNTEMDIRGMGTPLFVIDGVTRDQEYFSRMDPTEIDNISILKDGSAAIYGLRAANGVVLVTTKSGTAQDGKVDITYSNSFSTQQFLLVPEGVEALDYMILRNEQTFQNFNNNYLARQNPYFTQADMQLYKDGTKKSYNWMDAIFNKNSPQSQHNLNFNGGSSKLRYFMNLSYFTQEGSYKSGDFHSDRYNFRSTLDAEITKRLKGKVMVGGILETTTQPNSSEAWAGYKIAWLMRPDAPIFANDNPAYLNGDAGLLYDGRNMVAESNADIVGYRINKTRRLNGMLQLSYDIPGIKGLSAKGSYDYAMSLPDETRYHKSFFLYVYNPGTDVYTPSEKQRPTSIQRRSDVNFDTDMQLGLHYNNRFGKNNINSFIIFEEAYNSWDNFTAYRELLIASEYLFAGEDLNQRAIGGSPGDRLSQSLIGSLTYDYSGKYLVDFRFRYDGSSRFPKESRWGFFPSVSAGWRISEESFMKDNLPMINNLKLRASYGEMGDDGSASNYPPIMGYSIAPGTGSNSIGWRFGDVLNGGVRPQALPNPNLTWYNIKIYNVALDFAVLRSKLSGAFELYRRDRTGLLATSSAVVPGTVGATLPQENLNADRNFGWEFSLEYRDKFKNFNYYISPQISSTRSMRTKWLETVANNQFHHWQNRTSGRYKDIWWGNESVHMFTNLEEIRNYNLPMGQGSTPGDWTLNDWNGDGVINGDDDHPIAVAGLPKFYYGINMGGAWKGFDLAVNFQGAYRAYTQYGELLVEPLAFGGQQTLKYFLDRWRPADPNADYFSTETEWIPGYFPVTGHNGRRQGTNAVMNASYLRLKTVELGYTLPKELLSKVSIKNLRVYIAGYNILTFTPLKNADPERMGESSSDYADFYSYPNNKTYTVGASIKF